MDPTQIGMLGTEALRSSRDAFNQHLTFSIVTRDVTSAQGFATLDLECNDRDTYVLLVRGFKLLLEGESTKQNDVESATENKNTSAIWKNNRINQANRRKKKKNKRKDPAFELFQPVGVLDPLRAIRVGGGFLPTGGVKSIVMNTSRKGLSLSPTPTDVCEVGLPPAQFLGYSFIG
jgi:hypothetical protein